MRRDGKREISFICIFEGQKACRPLLCLFSISSFSRIVAQKVSLSTFPSLSLFCKIFNINFFLSWRGERKRERDRQLKWTYNWKRPDLNIYFYARNINSHSSFIVCKMKRKKYKKRGIRKIKWNKREILRDGKTQFACAMNNCFKMDCWTLFIKRTFLFHFSFFVCILLI